MLVVWLVGCLVVWLFGFFDISTFVDYFMSNSVFIYVEPKISKWIFVDTILDKQNLMCLHTVKWFQFIICLVEPCLSQEGQSIMLMFLNRLLKLFTLKNRFLMRAKALHSMGMSLSVQGIWHVKHCGCWACFSIKEEVNLERPIGNRDIMICPLLVFLKKWSPF